MSVSLTGWNSLLFTIPLAMTSLEKNWHPMVSVAGMKE
jgi:hypothetical protein